MVAVAAAAGAAHEPPRQVHSLPVRLPFEGARVVLMVVVVVVAAAAAATVDVVHSGGTCRLLASPSIQATRDAYLGPQCLPMSALGQWLLLCYVSRFSCFQNYTASLEGANTRSVELMLFERWNIFQCNSMIIRRIELEEVFLAMLFA